MFEGKFWEEQFDPQKETQKRKLRDFRMIPETVGKSMF